MGKHSTQNMNGKGKAQPRTGYEGSEREIEVSLYSFFNLGARCGGRSKPRPDRYTPGTDPVPIL